MGIVKTLLWPFFQGEASAPPPGKQPPPPIVIPVVPVKSVPGVDLPTTPADFGPPPFPPLVANADRQRIFGRFDYEPEPIPGNEEHVRILGDWSKNIIWVPIAQLRGIPGVERQDGKFPSPPGMLFHKLGASQLQNMWADWERAGLLHLIHTFEGSFSPRFVRGSSTNLSNHAFGNAFDINYAWNTLGAEPAAIGRTGSVRELVPIASHWGFYWGGFYRTRKDGMHFEIAKVMP